MLHIADLSDIYYINPKLGCQVIFELKEYNTDMKFAQILRELREDKGLSQEQLAEATGLSQSAIARWELSQSEPTVSAIIVLCKFFGESADYLLGLEEY